MRYFLNHVKCLAGCSNNPCCSNTLSTRADRGILRIVKVGQQGYNVRPHLAQASATSAAAAFSLCLCVWRICV